MTIDLDALERAVAAMTPGEWWQGAFEKYHPGASILSAVWLAYVLGAATAVIVGAIGGVL